MCTSLFCLYKKSGLLPSIFIFYSSEHNWFYQFLITLLSIREKEYSGFNEICSFSDILAACGDSLIPMLVGFAAYGGKAHQQTLANCQRHYLTTLLSAS